MVSGSTRDTAAVHLEATAVASHGFRRASVPSPRRYPASSSLAATAIAMGLNHFLPTVSPLLIAIVCGAVLANLIAVPVRLKPGLTFASKRLLRIGVALLGFQLVVGDIIARGWDVIVVVVSIVVFGIVGTMFVGRLLGLTWTQRLLIACGFSVCGAAAVAAVDGVVDAEEDER